MRCMMEGYCFVRAWEKEREREGKAIKISEKIESFFFVTLLNR